LPPDFPASWGGAWQGRGTIVVKGKNCTIRGLRISGARSNDFNGAGIRHEGEDIFVYDCELDHNENGILGSEHDDPNTPDVNEGGTVWIQGNHLHHNGAGGGQSHNIYIGRAALFVFINNLSEASKDGHLCKGRGTVTVIYGNIFRDADGTPSYHIDIEALHAFVVSNTHEKTFVGGPNTLIHFYIWHYAGQPMELHVKDNRMIAAVDHKGHFLWVQDAIETKDPVTHKTVMLPPDPINSPITGSAKGNVCVYSPTLTPKGAPSPLTFGAQPFAVPASFGIDPSNIVKPLGQEPADTRSVPMHLKAPIPPELLQLWSA
jgi:hypothetical protein